MTWCGQSDWERDSRVSSLAASFSSGALTTSHWKYPLKNVFDLVTLTYQLGLDIPIFDLHDEWQDRVPVHSARRVVQHSHTMSKVLHCPLTSGVKSREYPSFLSMVSCWIWSWLLEMEVFFCLIFFYHATSIDLTSQSLLWKWQYILIFIMHHGGMFNYLG